MLHLSEVNTEHMPNDTIISQYLKCYIYSIITYNIVFSCLLTTIDLLLEKFPVNFVQAESTFFLLFPFYWGCRFADTQQSGNISGKSGKNCNQLSQIKVKSIEVQPWLKIKL